MKSTRPLRHLAYVTLAIFVGASSVRAQDAPDASAADDGTPTVDPATTSATEAAPPTDIVEATWAARREYHRQLRSVDLSSLGTAASSISLGAYSLTRDAPFTRGLGAATLVGGSTQLIFGIVFTIRSQRAMSPERAPDEFREGDPYTRELEGAEHRQDLFLAYLSTDAGIISAGITTALAGVAREKAATQGVGIGIASQGVVSLLIDLSHQDQGRRYLRTLRALNPALTVTRNVDGGRTVLASLSWTR